MDRKTQTTLNEISKKIIGESSLIGFGSASNPDPAEYAAKEKQMYANIAARRGSHGDDPALGRMLNTYENIKARNPGNDEYDPALGEYNPWYQRLGHSIKTSPVGQWVSENPIPSVAIGAGVPLALAGSYLAYKKMKENKK